MKNEINRLLLATLVIVTIASSCKDRTDHLHGESKKDTTALSSVHKPLRENVLTSAEQKGLTPDSVIQNLKEGNKDYMENRLTANDYIGMMKSTSHGQYPEAFILSCIDSRVPVEEVFDKAIGDLFVGRVAGNIVDEDMLGSMEYGCKISGAKLIVVLGHESCGAIKAAIENERLGNITALLAKVKPALEKSKDFNGEKTAANPAFVEYVVKNNITNAIQTIQLKSPVLKEMMNRGEIKIVGAYYSLETGQVSFLN